MTASVSHNANIVPRASHNDMQARKNGIGTEASYRGS
jgi:hypothetical protein